MKEISSTEYDIAIVGGGMSGTISAIKAAECFTGKGIKDYRIVILDAAARPLQKIYATGNGRCNLTNDYLSDECYYSDSGDPMRYLSENASERIRNFYTQNGIFLHDRNGYVYPRTDHAGTVVKGLTDMLDRLHVEYISAVRVTDIIRTEKRFLLRAKSQDTNPKKKTFELSSSAVILACGGMVNNACGCSGDGMRFARSLEMQTIPCVPGLTGLTVEEPLLNLLHGIRCQAAVWLELGYDIETKSDKVLKQGAGETEEAQLTKSDKVLKQGAGETGESRLTKSENALKKSIIETGEVQLTKNGVSGIPVFQISRTAARALEANQKTELCIDFLPELETEVFEAEIRRRVQNIMPDETLADLFTGLVHPAIASYIIRSFGYADEKKIKNLCGLKTNGTSVPSDGTIVQPDRTAARLDGTAASPDGTAAYSDGTAARPDGTAAYSDGTVVHSVEDVINSLLGRLKCCRMPIIGTFGFDHAQVTAGGISLREFDENLQSCKIPRLFAAGEVLDADGICGGYNLTFAYETGCIAGRAAAELVI